MDLVISFTAVEHPREVVKVLVYPLPGGYLCRELDRESSFYLREGHQENWDPIIREILSHMPTFLGK